MIAVKLRLAGSSSQPAERHIPLLEAGIYKPEEPCNLVHFLHQTVEEIAEWSHSLEIEGYPIPGSLRITGFDAALSKLAVERGRLPHMYKVGSDTSATMILLLHGASRLSLDGYGPYVMPTWIDEDNREDFLKDIATMAVSVGVSRPITDDEKQIIAPRLRLELLHGEITKNQKRFIVPAADVLDWNIVSFRLTLGIDIDEDKPILVVEKFEVGGAALVGSAVKTLSHKVQYAITLFLGPGKDGLTVSDSRPAIDFIDISGQEILDSLSENKDMVSKFSAPDLAELSRRTGIGADQFREALGSIRSYRLHGGLLQRWMYQKNAGTWDWLTVIPEGAWRSVDFQGRTRSLTLRRYIILVFHCGPVAPHQDRERTINAITEAGMWWKTLYADVQTVIRHCLVCANAKGKPVITGHQRSRDYDGPFRYLIIDFVGPITPKTSRGHSYMFTCCCGYSGYYWAVPTPDDKSETAASCLFNRVICDIAGYPMFLGSDRALAFVEGVVKALSEQFGIVQVIGTAYHPQSQSAVERPHREYNALCKTYMTHYSDWDKTASIFQWSVRSSTKLFNGSYSPYEVITGLKPRTPLDALVGVPATVKNISTETYVVELVKSLKKIHNFVADQHKRIQEKGQLAKYRQYGPGVGLSVGDYVLVRRPMQHGVSHRLQDKNFDTVFQVIETHGDGNEAKAYTLCDLHGKRDGLGFSQPVAAERLTPVEMMPLAAPSEDVPTKILIEERGNREREAVITQQAADGKVYIEFSDNNERRCVDLAQCKYRWV